MSDPFRASRPNLSSVWQNSEQSGRDGLGPYRAHSASMRSLRGYQRSHTGGSSDAATALRRVYTDPNMARPEDQKIMRPSNQDKKKHGYRDKFAPKEPVIPEERNGAQLLPVVAVPMAAGASTMSATANQSKQGQNTPSGTGAGGISRSSSGVSFSGQSDRVSVLPVTRPARSAARSPKCNQRCRFLQYVCVLMLISIVATISYGLYYGVTSVETVNNPNIADENRGNSSETSTASTLTTGVIADAIQNCQISLFLSADIDNTTCRNLPEGLYPSTSSCREYFKCSPDGSVLTKWRCPCNYYFHDASRSCVYQLHTYYRFEDKCHDYYRCEDRAGIAERSAYQCHPCCALQMYVNTHKAPTCGNKTSVPGCS